MTTGHIQVGREAFAQLTRSDFAPDVVVLGPASVTAASNTPATVRLGAHPVQRHWQVNIGIGFAKFDVDVYAFPGDDKAYPTT